MKELALVSLKEIPGRKFTDSMQSEIKSTSSLINRRSQESIVDKPIVLNIFSHTCPDLTLIDLPGITRIPLAGLISQTTLSRLPAMANRYVSDPRTSS